MSGLWRSGSLSSFSWRQQRHDFVTCTGCSREGLPAQALLSPPCSDSSRVPRFRCHQHLLPVHYWHPCPDSPSHAPWNLSLTRSSSPSSFFSDVLWAQQRLLRPFLRPSAHPKMTLAPLDGAGVWSLSYGPCFSHCNLSSPWVSTLPASYIRGHINVCSLAPAFIKQTPCERPSGQDVHPEPCPLGGSGTVSGSWLPEWLSSTPLCQRLQPSGPRTTCYVFSSVGAKEQQTFQNKSSLAVCFLLEHNENRLRTRLWAVSASSQLPPHLSSARKKIKQSCWS